MVADRYQRRLKELKENVANAYNYFKPNYARYHSFRNFVFSTSISNDEKAVLQMLLKPQIECNIIEPYISRLLGEFSKQEPSVKVESSPGKQADPKLIKLIAGHMRAQLVYANRKSFEYEVYRDLLTGGFSVMKVRTDYQNSTSFDQDIFLERPKDVTLCGFDPLASERHKGDGEYCFELFPKSKAQFEEEYPDIDIGGMKFTREVEGFSWSYVNQKDDILLIADYSEKKRRQVKLYQVASQVPNGKPSAMLEDDYEEMMRQWHEGMQSGQIVRQPPAIIDSRKTTITNVVRYRFIENTVIEYVDTDFCHLPLIFVDGNSVLIKENDSHPIRQMTRPYGYQAQGLQRLKNFAMQCLGNELENLVQHKWKVAKESIPQEYSDAYTNSQIPNVVIYNAYKDNNPNVPLPPPQEIMRPPIPQEILATFTMADQSMQMVMGSYDASLGINNNQLSGVAIVEGATQSNATAMPYVVGFLEGMNQVAQIQLALLPKYFKTQRTMPVVDEAGKREYVEVNAPGGIKLDYEPSELSVMVEAGVNFSVQKSRAIQQLIALAQAMPIFAQFMNTVGLEVLISNLEIYGIDQLKELAVEWSQKQAQQQQQQQSQPNPVQMKMQIEQAKMQAEQQQNQMQNQLESAKISVAKQEADTNQMKVLGEMGIAQQENLTQVKKADAEIYSKTAELAMQAHDQMHTHAKEALELGHNIITSQQQENSVNE